MWMPPTLAYNQRDLLNVTCALRLLGVQFDRLYAICTCRLTLRIPLVGIFWRQKCNYNNVHVTASVYNIYGALYLGVFAGMRPCGVIVLQTELFIAESNTQVYGSLHNYTANHPNAVKRIGKGCSVNEISLDYYWNNIYRVYMLWWCLPLEEVCKKTQHEPTLLSKASSLHQWRWWLTECIWRLI